MRETEKWSQFHNALGLGSLWRRLDILRGAFLDHRFERRSPLESLGEKTLDEIYQFKVTFPPRRLLMQPATQTIDGLFFLASLAQALRARSVFEIGTYIGTTAWTMARNVRDTVVYTLDIPAGATPKWALAKDDTHRASENDLVYPQVQGYGRIEQLWGDSATFDFSPWYGKVDLVYIDGAHSEPYVRSDTEHALALVSTSGAVVWDDYWRLSPGVVTVLHEETDRRLFRVPGTRLVVFFADEGLILS